jgi:hypothetical protein
MSAALVPSELGPRCRHHAVRRALNKNFEGEEAAPVMTRVSCPGPTVRSDLDVCRLWHNREIETLKHATQQGTIDEARVRQRNYFMIDARGQQRGLRRLPSCAAASLVPM